MRIARRATKASIKWAARLHRKPASRCDACSCKTGLAVLVLADSVVQREALYADDVIADLAADAGLAVISSASQKRPHFHEPSRDAFRGRPRREHVFVLAHGDDVARAGHRLRIRGSSDRTPRCPSRGAVLNAGSRHHFGLTSVDRAGVLQCRGWSEVFVR